MTRADRAPALPAWQPPVISVCILGRSRRGSLGPPVEGLLDRTDTPSLELVVFSGRYDHAGQTAQRLERKAARLAKRRCLEVNSPCMGAASSSSTKGAVLGSVTGAGPPLWIAPATAVTASSR